MSYLTIFPLILVSAVSGAVLTALIWSPMQRKREDYRRRLSVFTTLMANRSAIESLQFVRALNCVEVVFYKNAAVRQRFKLLIQNLSSIGWGTEPSPHGPSEQTRDLLAQMLVWMAIDLDFELSYAELKQDVCMAPSVDNDRAEFRTLNQLFREGFEE